MRKIDLNNFQVASSETARAINSRIILNLVRRHQPVSRADLMRFSGLQRSTVSVITEELIKQQWLREGEIGRLPRGRRPTFLHLNENRAGIFGVDIRPKATNYALANMEGRFLVHESFPTPSDPGEFVAQISRRIRDLIKIYPRLSYEGVGVSLPGRVEWPSQKIVFVPNLHWPEVDLKTLLEQKIGLPVDMENAANACALSEFWFGRHSENLRDLAVLTVSEGIGVGMILNGQLVRGHSGLAGEFGHVAIVENGLRCGCGNHGCWEVYASNSAALRYFNEARAGDIKQKADSLNNGGALSFEELLKLFEQGNPKAREALERMANYLGKGIAMLVTGLTPEQIVVVGEITRVWDQLAPVVTDVVRRCSFTHATTRILSGNAADQPRLRGIIALILQKRFGAPNVG
ncbi:MAG TPA: ROK family protein [Verrucomicrobiae bacterium]|nr:ROK family protein [Verrucomicrobiae bacterium]